MDDVMERRAAPTARNRENDRPTRRAMGLVTVAWVFGSVWVTATSGAPLAQFAKALGASNFEFGLLSALPFIASLASMPAGLLTDRIGVRKPIFLIGLYAQRFLWAPISLVPLWLVHRGGSGATGAAMTIFLVLMFLMHAGQAVGGPAWVSWMADLVPARVRGKYFSRRRQWGIISAIPAAFFAGWLLDRPEIQHGGASATLVTLNWCALLFLCAGVFGVADIALFQFIDDIPAKPRPHVSWKKMFAEPLRNREFLWFGGFVAVLTFAVSFMGQFVTLYLIEKLKVTNKSTQMMLLVGPMLAQLAMLPVWGHAVDRMGKKPVLAISALGLVPIGFGWCFMNGGGAGSIWLGYFLAAAGAALWAGVEVANFNLVLEFSGSTTDDGEAGGSNYVAVNSVIINVAGCLGGLASGLIAKALGSWNWHPPVAWLGTFSFYEVLFAISGVLRLLAVVIFLPKVHEPEARPTVEALRFMTANIYNNVFNAVFLPLRVMGIRKRETQTVSQMQ